MLRRISDQHEVAPSSLRLARPSIHIGVTYVHRFIGFNDKKLAREPHIYTERTYVVPVASLRNRS